MNFFVLLVFPLIFAPLEADKSGCLDECPEDCGVSSVDADGCVVCDCSVNPFAEPPTPDPPSKRDASEDETAPIQTDGDLCRMKCPQDCGCLVEKGTATCHCTAENHPLIRTTIPTPIPPTPSTPAKRDVSDGDLCRKKCPADCGCLVNNGVASCRCTAENHPLIRTTPPRPPCHKALPTCEAPCKLEFVKNKICPECKCADTE
uniref:Antistasin-like domain-containing protein n=1 Tax=Strigamia maritima TaxID=126957 RepID=T1JIF3_STRMM